MRPVMRLLMPIIITGLLINSQAVTAEATIHASTAPLKELMFFPRFSAPATTVSLNDSRISAETSGRIEQINVKVGDDVEAGTLLATLDCSDNTIRHKQAEAALESAKARHDLARKQILRTRSLRKERNISEELYNRPEHQQGRPAGPDGCP
ncbi:efflux RND transporter periplasmic adaptor subunit [Solemya velesiana gill symbiont]|uniref:Uncharacterized protein n=1 Tax=Solemya velesiana gill symbiont TaxID=1918948 RepID=A0A1T2KUW3_9GAMM|nr:biotin/lipoyl-binding protein [Solemya velesiana gill symbiont]OOZ36506.1 hypothetical protein BOW51_06730 [Solemya velesiana gill symbiont]